MKINSPLLIIIRIFLYALVMFGIAEGIFFDAGHPNGESYFGEFTFVEIGQETILFLLFVLFLILGSKWKEIKPVSIIASLFFLMSFIREFNFILDKWIYPVLAVFIILVWFLFRNFKKIKGATIVFFSIPASTWLMSGFLVTYIFSRLIGRSKFWLLMYHEDNYRLAKAATEEGIELLGNTLMLIGAVEFFLYFWEKKKNQSQAENN